MCLVDDNNNKVPVHPAQSRQDVVTLRQVSLHHEERLVELLLQLALPLEREVRRRDG